jgi:hypothetical protein
MVTFTPNAYLLGGPVPVGSAVKDPRVVTLPAGTEIAEDTAEDGSGLHVWRRTDRFRDFEGLDLREYEYEGPAES